MFVPVKSVTIPIPDFKVPIVPIPGTAIFSTIRPEVMIVVSAITVSKLPIPL